MSGDKPSVLVIDDEPRFLASLAALLGDEFHVFTSPGGEEGLSVFERICPSLVLLDLCMPDMPGPDVLVRIRRDCREVPVIIMTGASSHEYAKQCADLNVQGYIEKPFDPEQLLERMRKLTGLDGCKYLRLLWGEDFQPRYSRLSQTTKKAMAFICTHLQTGCTRKDIAGHLGVSPDYLSRSFSEECGITLFDYINICRISRGKEYLLKFPDRKISEISSLVGFSDANYFRRHFRKQTGLSPTEYKNAFL